MLAEAQHEWRCAGGAETTPTRLGAVGSRIVVETFAGLLLNDGHSLLRQASTWLPEIGKRKHFDLADFVKYALGI